MSAHTMAEAIETVRNPFDTSEVEWRIQSSGEKGDKVWAIVVPYITARAVHDRLDDAFGMTGWYNEFRVMEVPGGSSGIICRIHYCDPEHGVWRWKENGAGQTKIEPFMGGLSHAEKRAFEQLGGGRYLYSLDTQFAETGSKSAKCPEWAKTKGGTTFYWGPPLLPSWAIPGVKKSVNETANEVLGEPIADRPEFPAFDIIINSMTRRPGVSELRSAKVYAQDLGWDDDMLAGFADSIGVDLHALDKAKCIKIRDMIRAEFQGGK